MIFGYSTNAFVNFSLSEAVDAIAALGFRGVEIMGDRPHLYPPDFSLQDIDALAQQLETKNLKITNINSFTLFAVGDTYLPSWIEPDASRRQIRIDHTLQSLKVAKQLNCTNISIPPGGPLNNMTRKEALKHFYAGLGAVVPLAEELGVKLLVEPEPALLLERTSEFIEFMADVRSAAVGLNFDIGHFICAGEDPAAAMEQLFQWIGHMHIEDIAADRSHNHLIPGLGAIDFEAVFKKVALLGYRGDISLELYPYTDQPEKAGREGLAHLKPYFESIGVAC